MYSFICSGGRSAKSTVSMNPGHTFYTVIPRLATSLESVYEKAICPALEAA